MPQEGRRFMSRPRRVVSPIASVVPSAAAPPSTPPPSPLDPWIDQVDAISAAADRHHRAVGGFAALLGFVSTHQDLPGHDPIDGWSALAELLAADGKHIDAACTQLLQAMTRARKDAITTRAAR